MSSDPYDHPARRIRHSRSPSRYASLPDRLVIRGDRVFREERPEQRDERVPMVEEEEAGRRNQHR
jgi:hypothetical protein